MLQDSWRKVTGCFLISDTVVLAVPSAACHVLGGYGTNSIWAIILCVALSLHGMIGMKPSSRLKYVASYVAYNLSPERAKGSVANHRSLVVFYSVVFQEHFIFFLKRPFLVMFVLSADVAYCFIQYSGTHGKCCVAVLPCEKLIVWMLLFNPLAAVRLYISNEIG